MGGGGVKVATGFGALIRLPSKLLLVLLQKSWSWERILGSRIGP